MPRRFAFFALAFFAATLALTAAAHAGLAGLPPAALEKLIAAINRTIQTPAFKARFGAIGDEPAGGTSQEFADTIARDAKKWGDVVKRAQVKLN